MEGGFCPESIFPSPEEREYRERWSPFKGTTDGAARAKLSSLKLCRVATEVDLRSRGRGMFEKSEELAVPNPTLPRVGNPTELTLSIPSPATG